MTLPPEIAWYLETRGMTAPDCPPRWQTPPPKGRGVRFDPDRVDRVLAALGRLRHTQGRWAGKPLKPEPWQVAYILAPVFGWVRRDETKTWVRVHTGVFVEMPRKNGKTTLSGGVSVYMLAADGEPGAQAFAVAAGKDQARFVFDPVRQLALKSPYLAPHVSVKTDRIVHEGSGSFFAVVSSVADLLMGANVHFAVIDELHVHRSAALVDAVESGTGARQQPLVWIITTADDGRTDTVYARKRSYIEQLAAGTLKDPATHGVIWAAEEADDPFAEATWMKANPGYGISPTRSAMAAAAQRAKQSPVELAKFQRLHLGVRVSTAARFLTGEIWDASAGMVDETALVGKPCFGGLDLASVSDLTALCWLFPDGDGYDAIWRFWAPAEAMRDLDRRTAGNAQMWLRQGWLRTTTASAGIDNDAVLAAIDRDAATFKVRSLGYDRWGATDVVRRLADRGMTCVGVGQGFASLNGPMKELLRLLLAKKLRHGGNPVMRWMVGNLAVASDAAGNIKPDKEKSTEKIDGVSALATALREALDTAESEKAPARVIGYY